MILQIGDGLALNSSDFHDLTVSKSTQEWKLIRKSASQGDAKPATSCHMTYIPKLESVSDCTSWTLTNEVTVRKSANCTYFCVVGWSPGGYSGIQQISESEKVVIYSMWNDGNNLVTCDETGKGVTVTDFGGEGTGLKSMTEIDWTPGETIAFKIFGKLDTGGNWKVSGWFKRPGTDWSLMATFSRPGSNPLNPKSGFYSFVEDWDRSSDAKGYKSKRSAVFSRPKLEWESCETEISDAKFTKVESGLDAYAANKAKSKINWKGPNGPTFQLSTGGGWWFNPLRKFL